MKKFKFFLIGIILTSAISCNRQTTETNTTMVECGQNYELFMTSLEAGKSARIESQETIASLGIIEKSEIIARPVDGKFLVTFKVLSFEPSPPNRTKGVISNITTTCPAIVNNLSLLENKTAQCIAVSPLQAKELAQKGLSEKVIDECYCHGELIDIIKEICMPDIQGPGFHNFPPGVKKPAVYLYPTEKSDIMVKVSVNGFITESIPVHGTGWNVNATPDGIIDGQYDYLYYEAQLKNIEIPETGWVVPYADLDKWFSRYLPSIGLNKKETSQFKEYWLKELPEAAFYEMRLLEKDFLDNNMNLTITPVPDKILRIIFVFKPLDEYKNLTSPEFKPFSREGFTVVEWGGLMYDKVK